MVGWPSRGADPMDHAAKAGRSVRMAAWTPENSNLIRQADQARSMARTLLEEKEARALAVSRE